MQGTKMAEKRQFHAIKGVRDILPPESALWNRVEATAREIFATYGYGEIRLPIFENTELFARSIGAETDVVSKEMYTFEDHDHADLSRTRSSLLVWEPLQPSFENIYWFFKQLKSFQLAYQRLYEKGEVPRTSDDDSNRQHLFGLIDGEAAVIEKLEHANSFRGRAKEEFIQQKIVEAGLADLKDWVVAVIPALQGIKLGNEITLRPEATASACRAYIEHGMHTLPGNVKLYYMGPMFRRERPQKGRYRQFYQIGAEVLGQSDAPAIDAELIEMLVVFFERAGLTGTTLAVNSIGCKECRPKYVELLRAELLKIKEELGADSQRRIETNPLRVLDSKLTEEQAIIEKLPRISDHLCADCRAHFAKLQAELKLRGIPYEINWRLVRGLDYYTRTTFEITAPGLGSQNAVCGGGRYDGLVELLGGPPTKGIGFAIGTDRLILSLQETGKAKATASLDVFVAWMGAAAYPAAVRLARRLRGERLSVEIPAEETKFKKALGLADKLRARQAVIIGDDEISTGQFTLKNLATGEQKKFGEAELVEFLKASAKS
jgi:histidyl-tRNA synthetase